MTQGEIRYETTKNKLWKDIGTDDWIKIFSETVWLETADPSGLDGTNSGIQIDALWINTTSGDMFLCTATTTTTSTWFSIGGGAGITPTQSTVNTVVNGDFEYWTLGGNTIPDDWVLSGTGASVAQDALNEEVGAFSAALTCSNPNGAILTRTIDDFEYYKGKTVTLGMWVKTSTATRANIFVGDGVGTTTSSNHTGGGGMEYLTVTHVVSVSATYIKVNAQIIAGTTITAYFDGAIMVEGTAVPSFSPTFPQGLSFYTTGGYHKLWQPQSSTLSHLELNTIFTTSGITFDGLTGDVGIVKNGNNMELSVGSSGAFVFKKG